MKTKLVVNQQIQKIAWIRLTGKCRGSGQIHKPRTASPSNFVCCSDSTQAFAMEQLGYKSTSLGERIVQQFAPSGIGYREFRMLLLPRYTLLKYHDKGPFQDLAVGKPTSCTRNVHHYHNTGTKYLTLHYKQRTPWSRGMASQPTSLVHALVNHSNATACNFFYIVRPMNKSH